MINSRILEKMSRTAEAFGFNKFEAEITHTPWAKLFGVEEEVDSEEIRDMLLRFSAICKKDGERYNGGFYITKNTAEKDILKSLREAWINVQNRKG